MEAILYHLITLAAKLGDPPMTHLYCWLRPAKIKPKAARSAKDIVAEELWKLTVQIGTRKNDIPHHAQNLFSPLNFSCQSTCMYYTNKLFMVKVRGSSTLHNYMYMLLCAVGQKLIFAPDSDQKRLITIGTDIHILKIHRRETQKAAAESRLFNQ